MKYFPVLAALILGSTQLTAADSVTVGIMKETLKGGGKTNVCSTPFVASPVLTFTISAVSGNVLTTGGVNASAVSTSANYAEILTSDGVKEIAAISAVSSTTVTLASSTSAAAGDTVSLRPYQTLDGLLGSANKFGFKASATGVTSGADQILVLDPATQTFSSYFYSTYPGYVGWYNTTTFTAAGSTKIAPGSGLVFRVVGPDVTVYFAGEVQNAPVETKIAHGINLIAVNNPLVGSYAGRMLTLTASDLYSGDASLGVKPESDGGTASADWVYIFNPNNQTLGTHFYSTYPGYVGWYNTTSFTDSASSVLSAGTAFYLYRRGNAFYWTQPADYLP